MKRCWGGRASGQVGEEVDREWMFERGVVICRENSKERNQVVRPSGSSAIPALRNKIKPFPRGFYTRTDTRRPGPTRSQEPDHFHKSKTATTLTKHPPSTNTSHHPTCNDKPAMCIQFRRNSDLPSLSPPPSLAFTHPPIIAIQ